MYADVNHPKKPPIKQHGIQLIVQYYQDSAKDRQAEIDMCLVHNASNNYILIMFVMGFYVSVFTFDHRAYISNIHILLEKLTDFDEDKFNSPKISIHVIGRRLNYKTALEFANKKLAGKICILANCDIFLD